MKRIADSFINQNSVIRNVNIGLIPMGKTMDYIRERELIEVDQIRNEEAKIVKDIITKCHRDFINNCLSSFEFERGDLEKYMELYNTPMKDLSSDERKKVRTEFKDLKKNMREQISEVFKNSDDYGSLFSKDLITKKLPEFVGDNAEELSVIRDFNNFTTYFKKYNEAKKRMYEKDEKHGNIAYRTIHQNLTKYINNISVFNKVYSIPEIKSRIDELANIIGCDVVAFFNVDGFNSVISQSGIDKYNTVIGGFSREDETKVQGLNEIVNLYNQQYKKKLPKFEKLFKQILSLSETSSFVYSPLASDVEVFDLVRSTYNYVLEEVIETKNCTNIVDLINNIEKYDLNGIYINKKDISNISNYLFGDYSVINHAIENDYERLHKKGRSIAKWEKTKDKYLKSIDQYSISSLNNMLEMDGKMPCITKYFKDKVSASINDIQDAYLRFSCIDIERYTVNGASLKSNDFDKRNIQVLLDSIKKLKGSVYSLSCGIEMPERDDAFYGDFSNLWDTFREINAVYNKVRNYVTGKPFETETIKLNFDCSRLLDGWSLSAEAEHSGQLYKDDNGNIYLGILCRGNKAWINNIPVATTDRVYHKFIFNNIGKIRTHLKNIYNISIKNEDPNWKDEVDRAKKVILEREAWNIYHFEFSDTSSYNYSSDFVNDVESQGFSISTVDVDVDYINERINNGDLYFFQLYNKDFSPYSKGTPDLHTCYLREMFSDRNIANPYMRIGAGEVRFRPASLSIEDTAIHKANNPIKNKNHLNPKGYSSFSYDIIRNRRYTKDHFELKLPITFNYKDKKLDKRDTKKYNNEINSAIYDADNVGVIGIDRGENNLIYITRIDSDGNIIYSKSCNIAENVDPNGVKHRVDYKHILKEKEKANKIANLGWGTKKSTKSIKESCCGRIAAEIVKEAIETNSIIVMEKLDSEFMRKHQMIDSSVYKVFEKALINKGNYYVDKHLDVEENGGIRRGYSITNEFDSSDNVWQSGMLYYINPAYTSKIDPATGFVNLFGEIKYKNISSSREFISRFDKICFDNQLGMYAFSFDYTRFTYKADNSRRNWTVYTVGNRTEYNRVNGHTVKTSIDLTTEFDKLFEEYGISKKADDMRQALISVDNAEFYKRFLKLFFLTVILRNQNSENEVDEIISPVMNSSGQFFLSGKYKNLPVDGDSNGSYCIALKGLMKLNKIKEANSREEVSSKSLAISNDDWFNFVQNRSSKFEYMEEVRNSKTA